MGEKLVFTGSWQSVKYLTKHFAFLISIDSQELNAVTPILKLRKYKSEAEVTPK